MFCVIYGVFFAGWAESSRLAVLWANPRDNSIEWRGAADGMDRTHIHISPREFEEWRRRCPGFESFGAVVQRRVTLNDDAQEPEQIVIKFVTPGLSAMDRERVILGRDFAPEDGIPGNQYLVILSSRLWQERYGGDPHIIGKSLRLDGESYTVIGVMAPGVNKEPLWPVLAIRADESRMDDRILTVIARLKPGVSLRQAQAEIDTVSSVLAQEYPKSNAGWSVTVAPWRNNWLPRRTFQNLWLLMGAVTLVLLRSTRKQANGLELRHPGSTGL